VPQGVSASLSRRFNEALRQVFAHGVRDCDQPVPVAAECRILAKDSDEAIAKHSLERRKVARRFEPRRAFVHPEPEL
jgi:hypothetical protein